MAYIDLKTDRSLLDYKFEGYKLSLDPIPVLKLPIDGGVEAFEPDGEEYSFIQLHMSTHVNQLFQDVWAPSCVFFIKQKKFLCWSCLMEDGRLSSPRTIWQLPADRNLPKANASVVFPSAEWAVVGDGNGMVYLLQTPSRAAGEPWVFCHSYCIPVCTSSCYLLYGVHMTSPGRQQIDCVLAHFSSLLKEEKEHDTKSPPFKCLVEWLSFTCGQGVQDWSLKRTRRLAGTSALLYVALESTCDIIYTASESEYKLIYDSEKPCSEVKHEEKEVLPQSSLFTYIQTAEDITVVFRLPEQAKKELIEIHFQPLHLEILWKGEPVLKGSLENRIDCSASTWIVCGERLELILSKAEVGLMWRELVLGNKRGEELMDPGLVEEIHSRLAHLTSETEVCPANSTPFNLHQLEDCDSCNDMLLFVRIDGNTHEVTHRVNMGGHQWLFSSKCHPDSLPVICLRHDVDGLIWQPRNTSSEGELDHFKIEHSMIFSALGYVQASKQEKKYILCSPDFTYAVISDWARHVYIYCQPESLHSALELRNRQTGESVQHIAKQYVLNLENCDRVLGLRASNECIFVLNSHMLYAIKMCGN